MSVTTEASMMNSCTTRASMLSSSRMSGTTSASMMSRGTTISSTMSDSLMYLGRPFSHQVNLGQVNLVGASMMSSGTTRISMMSCLIIEGYNRRFHDERCYYWRLYDEQWRNQLP